MIRSKSAVISAMLLCIIPTFWIGIIMGWLGCLFTHNFLSSSTFGHNNVIPVTMGTSFVCSPANVFSMSSRALSSFLITRFILVSNLEFPSCSTCSYSKANNDSILPVQSSYCSGQTYEAVSLGISASRQAPSSSVFFKSWVTNLLRWGIYKESRLEKYESGSNSISLKSEAHNRVRSLNSNSKLLDKIEIQESYAGWASSSSKDYDLSLENINQQSDMDYFAFTPKNLHISQHAYWYANWTLKRKDDPRWSELGEWRLFAIDYFNTRNLDCGSYWIDCKDMPTWSDILTLYPDDRELARQVYFTSESYMIIRNYLKAIQSILDEVHMSLYGMLPEIIQVFTNQPDPSAQAACAMIGAVVDTLINVGVTAITGMMSSTLTSFYDKMKRNVIAATHDANEASKWYTKILKSKWIPNPIVKWLRNQDQFNAWGEITPVTDDELNSFPSRVSEISRTWSRSKYPPHSNPELVPGLQKIKDAYLKANKIIPWIKPITQMPVTLRVGLRFNLQNLVKDHSRLHLESGSLRGDGVCSAFNGGDVNNNAANINQVQGQLASVFPLVLDSLGDVYEGIYNGSLREEDQPSWLAISMLNHNWAEEKSYLERLRHGAAMKKQVMRAFTLNIASQVSAKDGSYMKCTHKAWAAEKCDKMAHAIPTDEAALAYFCPRPETDPGLICQVGRWAFSAQYSHETAWPALLKIESFSQNQFELTRVDLLNAIFDHYELHGNDLEVDWNSWFLGSLSSLNSFTMPVCVHDGLAMKDNIVHGPGRKPKGSNSWAVPNVCGINGSETERFFTELGFLEGSLPWKSKNKYEMWAGGGTNEFYNDRLVRANRDLFGTNPFLRYTTMCHQHIRFAEHDDWKRYDAHNLLNHARMHKGRDRDCDLVLKASANMTADEGNRWFCQKHYEYGMDYGHNIFAREVWKVEINRIPRDWVENHEHDCKKWLSYNKKGPMPPIPKIPGVPRPKTGMIWLQAMERKKLQDEQLATKEKNLRLDTEAELAFQKSLKSMSRKDAKVAKKRHKEEIKETKDLQNRIYKLIKTWDQKNDIDWEMILKYPPQDEYMWKGWKGIHHMVSHPIKSWKRFWLHLRRRLKS